MEAYVECPKCLTIKKLDAYNCEPQDGIGILTCPICGKVFAEYEAKILKG